MTDLNDIVFGGWDIFPDNAYEAAMYAEVLKEKDLNGVKDELELSSRCLQLSITTGQNV